MGASERVFELLDMKPKVPIFGGLPVADGPGIIAFENVSFAYPSRPEALVLDGVSFQVKKRGRKNAIICLFDSLFVCSCVLAASRLWSERADPANLRSCN